MIPSQDNPDTPSKKTRGIAVSYAAYFPEEDTASDLEQDSAGDLRTAEAKGFAPCPFPGHDPSQSRFPVDDKSQQEDEDMDGETLRPLIDLNRS